MLLKDYDLAKTTYKALTAKGFETGEQFLDMLPKKCLNYTRLKKLSEAVNEDAMICGYFVSAKNTYSQPVLTSFTLEEKDTGTRFKVNWFGQQWRMKFADTIRPGTSLIVMGRIEYTPAYGYQITMPDEIMVQRVEDANKYTRCIPRYKKIRGLSDEMAEKIRHQFVETVEEPFPEEVLTKAAIPGLTETYTKIHFPKTLVEFEEGISEHRFRELLVFSLALKKTYPKNGSGFVFEDNEIAEEYVRSLPYDLTEDQKNAVSLITEHAANGKRMRLLVQGDVGCGKTSVAIYSLLLAVGSGKQAVLLAPTTALAGQHYQTLQGCVNILNTKGYKLNLVYLSSNMKAAEKKEAAKLIASGEADIIVGTHSTFSDMYSYKNLGLIVVDEEHKFGVAQREKLKEKAEEGVHLISMSATPIPRSLASVLYGDVCEIVQIRTMPNGRLPIKTAITKEQDKVFSFINRKISEGDQVYVICPRVVEDDSDRASIEEAVKRYKSFFDPLNIPCEGLHGKMKKSEIESVLSRFESCELKILISTTVVEVGVNVPNANVIVIEDADMFGLASLHQLRGRVGRGSRQGYCVLKTNDLTNERLLTLQSTTDGFVIAEKDLEMRGTGNLLGTEQTGINKLINMSLDYPEDYKKASAVAGWMVNKGLT